MFIPCNPPPSATKLKSSYSRNRFRLNQSLSVYFTYFAGSLDETNFPNAGSKAHNGRTTEIPFSFSFSLTDKIFKSRGRCRIEIGDGSSRKGLSLWGRRCAPWFERFFTQIHTKLPTVICPFVRRKLFNYKNSLPLIPMLFYLNQRTQT